MSVAVEALFTSALGLQPPWLVDDVKLDTAKRRIDFEVAACLPAFPLNESKCRTRHLRCVICPLAAPSAGRWPPPPGRPG